MEKSLSEHLKGWSPERGGEALTLGDDFTRKVLKQASVHRLMRDCLGMILAGAAVLIRALLWTQTVPRGGHPKTKGGTIA